MRAWWSLALLVPLAGCVVEGPPAIDCATFASYPESPREPIASWQDAQPEVVIERILDAFGLVQDGPLSSASAPGGPFSSYTTALIEGGGYVTVTTENAVFREARLSLHPREGRTVSGPWVLDGLHSLMPGVTFDQLGGTLHPTIAGQSLSEGPSYRTYDDGAARIDLPVLGELPASVRPFEDVGPLRDAAIRCGGWKPDETLVWVEPRLVRLDEQLAWHVQQGFPGSDSEAYDLSSILLMAMAFDAETGRLLFANTAPPIAVF